MVLQYLQNYTTTQTGNFASIYLILLDYTYDVKLENLADFGVCGHLAVKVARVRRIGEFQLQRILPASGG